MVDLLGSTSSHFFSVTELYLPREFSYGKKGYNIIVHALQEMFPEQGTDIGMLSPLSWASVIHELLLPEAVIYLIQEDLRLPWTECAAIFRESSKTQDLELPAHAPEPQQEIKQEPIPIDPALLTPRRVTYINLMTPPVVKMEELPVSFNEIGLGSEVIDLTLDSDSDP